MAKSDHQENVVGPWAKEKLDALERYLKYYCLYLSKQRYELVYIDGFAGAPLTKIRQPELPGEDEPLLFSEDDDALHDQFVQGSPMRALQTNPGFDRHYFFDLDARRGQQLDALKAEHPDKRVNVEVGDANTLIRERMRVFQGKSNIKGVAFLDPYKANLEWATLEAIAATRSFEVIINLPLHMAINRLLKRGERNAAWEADIDRCFGTDEWRPLSDPEKIDLFGDTLAGKTDRVCDLLLDLYRKRLGRVFGHVSPAKVIRNTRNSPLYYLIWAGPHPAGLKGASYILSDRPKVTASRRP